MISRPSRKGFTLIELLVVIAIVAVVSVVVVLTLNPAELLRRARDANRISDMASLRTSLALYLANVSSPTLTSSTGYGRCYITVATTNCNFGFSSFPALNSTSAASTSTAVQSNGWLPVDFTQISSGPPLGSLPIDPVNTAASGCEYAYAATGTTLTYKLVASCMESTKYSRGGSNDVESTDGGSFPDTYEVGTNLSL